MNLSPRPEQVPAVSTKNHVWRRAALAVVLLLSGCTYSTDEPAPSSSTPNPFASLESQVQLFMDQGAVSAVVQVRWPEGKWSRAYGVRDLVSRTQAQPTDRAQVASVTKTMTAVAVLKLVDDHLIALDDPVNDVIPKGCFSQRCASSLLCRSFCFPPAHRGQHGFPSLRQ